MEAYVLDQKKIKIKKITAKVTMVATGGLVTFIKTPRKKLQLETGTAFVHRARR